MSIKEKLLVTVSGGRSSGYMAVKLFREYQDKYDMHFVYANTGQEHEKTLEFVRNIQNEFKIPIVWIEAVINGYGVGTGYREVTFETASRKGEPFEEVIKKYGLPTQGFMHCTRELKINPITAYMKERGISVRTLGIRKDEPKRYSPKDNVIYHLWDWGDVKKGINLWWSKQVFDLEIPDYLGNCTWCYKKSDKKLDLIATEHPEFFDFPLRMEREYPDVRRQIFRGYRTTEDVLNNVGVNLFSFDECAEECGSVLI
jgi:hypothetical protein